MKEMDFESTIPQQISKLQSDIQSAMHRMGAFAHSGTSGITYEEHDYVTSGSLSSPLGEETDPGFPTFHTHKPTVLYRDGVPVSREYSLKELEEMYDDEIGSAAF